MLAAHFHGECDSPTRTAVNNGDRKLAEELNGTINRKIIEAQEQERRRIARELHDDINQRLALINVELEDFLRKYPHLRSEARAAIVSVRERTMELSRDIEALSHELHSSRLEYLGLAEAIRGFCGEFGEKHAMEIDFRSQDLPEPLSQEVSLCLFRVLQEALSNALKYSGVKHVRVELAARSGQVHLTIVDWGRGFDPEKVVEGVGLGLTSMQERVRLVNGSIRIQSRPMAGTTLDVVVPLDDVSQELTA